MNQAQLEAALEKYQELAKKVDEKFAEIRAKHPQEFQCRAACHECCKPGLTLNPLEAEHLRRHLKANPLQGETFGKNRCALLGKNGNCRVYSARPLVCRSHGAPLQFRDPEAKSADSAMRFRDVCPLNFTNSDLGKLPAEDVLNLDTINLLLSLLSQQAFGKDSERIAIDNL